MAHPDAALHCSGVRSVQPDSTVPDGSTTREGGTQSIRSVY